MNWDFLISAIIIIGLILAIWAKMSQETVVELLRDIREFISESRENAAEKSQELIIYE